MKTFLKYSLLMAVVLVSVVALTACGGNSDDDPGKRINVTTGVHRIDVEFSGVADGWDLQTMFIGAYKDQTNVNLYENGQKINETAGSFMGKVFRNYSVETDADCDIFQVTVSLILKNSAAGTVTVTLRGYVNGQQKNMKVYEFKPDAQVKSCVFSAEDIGIDMMK